MQQASIETFIVYQVQF